MILLPLDSDRENIGYCVYSYDVTPYADSAQRASLSADTSSAVLQTCIKLRETGDSREKFREVIEDIRQICDADECGILLSDHQTCSCTLLGESIRPGCELNSISVYLDRNAYDFTMSWGETIGDSTCLILKDSQDMEWLKQMNPRWHESLVAAGIGSIVLFPLNYNDETLGYMWVTNLRARAEEGNLHFAIGIAVADGENDILKAMHIADEMMYIDKREYYEEHPERKYR